MRTYFKNTRNLMAAVCLGIALALAGASTMLTRNAEAATTNFPPNVPVYALPMLLPGAYTSTTTPVKFAIPYAARLVGFSAVAGTVSGTMTIDLQAGGVSLLSAPITASTNIVEATVATAAVADESTLTVVLTISGSNPTFSNVTIVPTFVR